MYVTYGLITPLTNSDNSDLVKDTLIVSLTFLWNPVKYKVPVLSAINKGISAFTSKVTKIFSPPSITPEFLITNSLFSTCKPINLILKRITLVSFSLS